MQESLPAKKLRESTDQLDQLRTNHLCKEHVCKSSAADDPEVVHKIAIKREDFCHVNTRANI